jgi:hypothetical protein
MAEPMTEIPQYNDFMGELKKWKEVLVNDPDILSPHAVQKKSLEMESKMNLSPEDQGLMGICSDLMGFLAKKPKGESIGSDFKAQAVDIQQMAFQEVLSRFHGGKFDDDKAPAYFLAMNEVFNSLRSKGLLENEYVFFVGLRGMISAGLLFSKAGFKVETPEISWDAYHDIDLLAEKEGKKYSVSVKSIVGFVDEVSDESFVIKREKRPSGLPESYYKEYSKHIWINIPNMTTEDGRAYCDGGFKGLAIGIPSNDCVKYFQTRLEMEDIV